ncbi:unnamed protein product [Symbiodinium natans]|uniref:Uncharacterized protein n=1 Tax=Symbiodinium natans TaxID=878477 RepID=A0A812QWR2_9DINO|nr:unnamed protein product [Symbiodinium natans]
MEAVCSFHGCEQVLVDVKYILKATRVAVERFRLVLRALLGKEKYKALKEEVQTLKAELLKERAQKLQPRAAQQNGPTELVKPLEEACEKAQDAQSKGARPFARHRVQGVQSRDGGAEGPEGPRLKFQSGAYSIAKAAVNADSYFLGNGASLGVADGISEWEVRFGLVHGMLGRRIPSNAFR